ncbi:MAG: hypothetical protein SFW65_07510 [Alphaproteobacteria bacterium]|nr:hypothetical protein [Alphaproteobacteria bacterium]
MQDWIRKALGKEEEPRTRAQILEDGHRARMQFREDEQNRRSWIARALNPRAADRNLHLAQYDPDAMDNRRRYSDNHLPPHPPVTVGGMTFHFQNNKAAWDRGGWGGPRQSQPGRVGTYSSTGDLGRDEQRLIVKQDGTGIFVVGGNGHNYARGTAVVNRHQVQHLRQHGVPEVPERPHHVPVPGV